MTAPAADWRRRIVPAGLVRRRNAAANIWPGTRLPAITARTVIGLANTRACSGAVRLSSVALLAAANRRACSMVSVPRASCARRSSALASFDARDLLPGRGHQRGLVRLDDLGADARLGARARVEVEPVEPARRAGRHGRHAGVPAAVDGRHDLRVVGAGWAGSSTSGAGTSINVATASWNAVLAGSSHGVSVVTRLISAPSSPSGDPALGKSGIGSSTVIARSPMSAPNLRGTSRRTSDSKSPWSLVWKAKL